MHFYPYFLTKSKKSTKKGSLIRSEEEGQEALIIVQFCHDVISKAVSHLAIRKMADILRAETKYTICTVNTLKRGCDLLH